MPTKEEAHYRSLKMRAVQIAGDFPGNKRDALFILDRVRKILEENVYDEEAEAPKAEVVSLSLVPSGVVRAS